MTVAIVEKLSEVGGRLLELTHLLCRLPTPSYDLIGGVSAELMVDPTISLAERLGPLLDVLRPAETLSQDLGHSQEPVALSATCDFDSADWRHAAGTPPAELGRGIGTRQGAQRSKPTAALISLSPEPPSLDDGSVQPVSSGGAASASAHPGDLGIPYLNRASTISLGQALRAKAHTMSLAPGAPVTRREAVAKKNVLPHDIALRQTHGAPAPSSRQASTALVESLVSPDANLPASGAPDIDVPQQLVAAVMGRAEETHGMPPDKLRLAVDANRLPALLRDSIAAPEHSVMSAALSESGANMLIPDFPETALGVDGSAGSPAPRDREDEVEQILAALTDLLELEFIRTYGTSGG